MSLSLGEMLGMRMRRTPVRLMRRSLQLLEAAGLSLPTEQLEMHSLAGGDVERTVEAYILAHRDGSGAEWMRLSALDLTGHNPVDAVRATLTERELVFDRYSPEDSEPIIGYTRDRSAVRGACRMLYRPPLSLDTASVLERLQERLSARLAITINQAESPRALEARRAEAEARLLVLASGILPSARSVQVRYSTVAAETYRAI